MNPVTEDTREDPITHKNFSPLMIAFGSVGNGDKLECKIMVLEGIVFILQSLENLRDKNVSRKR